MFCPRCSQQQLSGEVRFCSRCGFPLDGVAMLLSSDGLLPASVELPPPSPRLNGVRQGGLVMLIGIFLIPILAFLTEGLDLLDESFSIFTVVLFLLGGFLRIIYALLFQDGPLRRKPQLVAPVRTGAGAPEALAQGQRGQAALPPPQSIPASAYVPPRANTAEIAERPPSVTENTTRLLDDQ